MNDDRSLERAARSWLEDGPTQAPDRAVEAALLHIETTSQERDLRVPWRVSRMSTMTRIAVAAVVGVLVIGGFYFIGRSGQPEVGVSGPSTSPSPTAASPGPSSITPVRMPDAVLGDWQAVAAEVLPGVSEGGERIQLSLDWQNGESAWIQPEVGELSLHSASVAAAANELRFVSSERLGGCAPGDAGRYRWERSADGLFLTLSVVEDACASRAAAFGRTWVHSLGAVNDGGPGVIQFDPWIRATLPSARWAMGGPTDGPVIRRFGDGAPDVEFTVIRNPMGFDAPCASAGRRAVPIDPTAAAIVAHLGSLPGVTVATEDGSVDGRAAIHVTVESDAAVDCPAGEIMAFHPPIASDEGEYTMALGDPRSFWVVELGGDVIVLWYAGQGVTVADEVAVIDSVQFLDRLPTP